MILKRSLPDGSHPFFLPEVTPQELRRIAHAKRFVEHYSGDAASLRPARRPIPPWNCRDYHAAIGALPPTTTARPHKHIERLRTLLPRWQDYGFVYNGESIADELTPLDALFRGGLLDTGPVSMSNRIEESEGHGAARR